MAAHTEFRLKTAVKMIGILEPIIITPTIEEPIKWDDVLFQMEGDSQYHGINSDYSQGDIKLDFQCENAHELISAQYYEYGTDADVQFLVIDVDSDGTEYVEYDGKIDFETFQLEAGKVSVSVVRNNIHQKVSNRWESPIALDLLTTLDNAAIVPPSTFELPLPGQTIRDTGEVTKKIRVYETKEDNQNPGIGGLYTLLPNLMWPKEQNPVPPTASNFYQMEGVSTLIGGFMKGGPDDFPLIQSRFAGSYHIEIDWLTKVNMAISRDNAILEFGRVKYARWSIETLLIVKQPDKEDQRIELAPIITGSGESVFIGDKQVTVRYSGDFDLIAGSAVYLYIRLIALTTKSLKQLSFSADTSFLRVLIDRKTRAEASKTAAYMLPDVLKFVAGAITSNVDAGTKTGRVSGSLIDFANVYQPLDGPATEYAVASGGQLRGLKKAPTFTLKDLMETLWAHHTAGILYERDDNGIENIRVEPGEWFYRGDEIVRLDEVFEYSEEPDLDLLFNRLEVGYKKFQDEGPGVAEEFNTVRSYQTPLVNRDDKQEILCPLIAAGTSIEAARRLGLTKTDENGKVVISNDAGSYDDDSFILHIATRSYSDTVQFITKPPQKFPYPFETHYIQFSGGVVSKLLGGVSLKNGDVITFSGTGTANDGVPMTVVSLTKPGGSLFKNLTNSTYQVAAASFVATPGPVLVSWHSSGQAIKLRTNERLIVEGVTDPANTYNLELSPARMLRKHALFINSGLYFKEAKDEIKCTAYKQNGKMTTKVRPESAPLPGDRDKQLVRESGNVALGVLERFDKLFEPTKIKLTGRMTKKELRLLRDALRNQANEEINMGFVTVMNPDGNYVSGYVRNLSYNSSSEVVELTLRKKASIRNPNGVDCGNYRDWTMGRFETDKSADPNLYRFCRFSDFN